MSSDPFTAPLSRHVWETRYRWRDETVYGTWDRVARAVAAAESHPDTWAPRFRAILDGFGFLPGGRILAGAGTGRDVTLFNCFVMGVLPDDLGGIFEALREGALTMEQGGGIGIDFSTLAPRGTARDDTGTVAAGPVAFMRIWDRMCATIVSTGARRGAMMATLRVDHPDIEAFVAAKGDPGELRHFNVSVQVTDAFVDAVGQDDDWPLVWPDPEGTVHRRWTGAPVPCRVVRTVRARALWERILRSTYACAEPGVLFVDRINDTDNLRYRHRVTATNPCGEIPLQPYGACDLGSVNLARFVRTPFSDRARLDLDAIERVVPVAVRFLDDVVDVSRYPLAAQAEQARGTRRLGLGITGLGDALAMLGLPYDSDAARAVASEVMRRIRDAAYRASVELAREKGPFPFLDRDPFLDAPFVRALPEDIRGGIAEHGLRNSHLLAVAPTGTISLLANNVSSGIEPIFDLRFRRRVRSDGEDLLFDVEDRAHALWRERGGSAAFVTAMELSPEAHLAMEAAVQPFVDNAISKTINVPEDLPFEAFRDVYDRAWALGLKGCTTWRPNDVTGSVLERSEACPRGTCEI